MLQGLGCEEGHVCVCGGEHSHLLHFGLGAPCTGIDVGTCAVPEGVELVGGISHVSSSDLLIQPLSDFLHHWAC